MTKSLRVQTRDLLAQCSTIPCVDHFHRVSSPLEGLFWFVSLASMFILGSVIVHQNISDWQANPTAIVTPPDPYLVQSIQFPTITICADFEPDRFGFVRSVFDTFKFQCDDEEDCEETEDLRSFFKNSANQTLAELVAISFLNSLTTTITSNIPMFQSLLAQFQGFHIQFFSLYKLVLQDTYNLDPLLMWYIIEHYNHTQNFSALDAKLMDKLTGRTNNYEIYRFLNYDNMSTKNVTDIPVLLDQTLSTQFVQALKTAVVLSMPLPGGLGTIFTNFGNTFLVPDLQILATTGLEFEWFQDWAVANTHPYQMYILEFFEEMISAMLGVDDFGILPYDIPAVLLTDTKYLKYKLYPFMFTHTVWKLNRRHNVSFPAYPVNIPDGAKLYDTPSYFLDNTVGKMLGPFLKQVMEIMYQCIHRGQPLARDRYLDFPDVYGSLYQSMPFPRYKSSEPFAPTWKDFQGATNNSLMYYQCPLPYRFQADPDDKNRARYNGPDGVTEDEGLVESLRAKFQHMVMIAHCGGPGSIGNCDGQFYPVMTDNGICHAFNYFNNSAPYINNTYTNLFNYIFAPNRNGSGVHMNEGSGKAFQMVLILDSFKSKIPMAQRGTFKIAINQFLDFASVRDTAIEVERGTNVLIQLQPTQYVTTDAFRSLDRNTRNCLYSDENPDPSSLFPFYTEQSCLFECRLRNSQKQCNCTPWNYPQYGDGSITEICDGVHSSCFETLMNDPTIKNCQCQPDCEVVQFVSSVRSSAINYLDECQPYANSVNLTNMAIAQKLRHMPGEEFFTIYGSGLPQNFLLMNNEYIHLDVTLSRPKCQQLLQNDMAFVTIEISQPKVLTLQRDVSVTLLNQISAIGGAIGLFTGVSFLSVFEMGYWIYKLAGTAFAKRGVKKIPTTRK